MFKDKKKMWILILALVFIVCAGAFIALKLFAPEGSVARISVDGELLQTIDLSRVTEAYDIDIDTAYGHNTVHVEPGAISVTEADCPDGICVRQGKLTTAGVPIVCMPHRLVIEIYGDAIDG